MIYGSVQVESQLILLYVGTKLPANVTPTAHDIIDEVSWLDWQGFLGMVLALIDLGRFMKHQISLLSAAQGRLLSLWQHWETRTLLRGKGLVSVGNLVGTNSSFNQQNLVQSLGSKEPSTEFHLD